MLTLQQSYEVRASILEYLRATFTFREREVGEAFRALIEDERQGMFKGPYVSLKLPFVRSEVASDIPLTIRPPFPPFDHQIQAFRRLTTQGGHQPEPTILTTGTGSGKTESFLFPILDYCYHHADRRGIKCIILYPMNALATDQAARLARLIHADERLRGRLTAGLFIGVGRDGKKYPKDMAPDHIIENRDALLDAPPDILLTNFKMLDYALMRNQYHGLWRHNLGDPRLLRFLVLDELHTYDGAQGTDVANLIRRLKLKLDLPAGQLCPVGTSATIGSGEDAPALLADYAGKVFGEPFTPASIITEKRLDTRAFFGRPKENLRNPLPSDFKLQSTILHAGEEYRTYLRRQLDLWQIDPDADPVALGRELLNIRLVWDIVDLCSRELLTVAELIRRLNEVNDEFRKVPEWDEPHQFHPKEAVIRSILSLIAEARVAAGDRQLPFLYLQVQLWLREISGILRVFSGKPAFTWRDKLADERIEQALPAWYCRECGASGWLAVKHDNRNKFETDIGDVYHKYFGRYKNLYFVNTDVAEHRHIAEYTPTEALHRYVSAGSMELHDRQGPDRLGVFAYRMVRNNRALHNCPECNTRNTITIIGGRVSTLASVTTSQVLASDLDDQGERDRKLLTFVNGVQDAAHLAGYVEARNFRFAFRTALQKVINRQPAPLALDRLQEEFIRYWKEEADERNDNSLEAYLYKFFPPDRAGEVRISAYKSKDGSYKASFIEELDTRICWEIAAEFGYNAGIGRTLEKTGSSAVRFREEQLRAVFPRLRPWLEENGLTAIREPDFLRFLNALLHRLRIRGGIDHEYLSKYRTRDLRLWDLNWMNDRRHYLNRRFGPQSRFPRLLTEMPDQRGLVDSTFTRQENWYHAYYKKSFQMAPSYFDAVNEFYARLVAVLASEEVALLDQQVANGVRNYCLPTGAMEAGNRVVHFDCQSCGHRLSVEAGSAELVEGAKCLQYQCAGDYHRSELDDPDNYYRQVYNRRRAPRVYAADHTGLLERRDRENKERDFKERPRFNSLNTLVATSTLEMGIDIGDLNVTMNAAVPPLPSNFLQRVGRAGRKSGSALIINFASNDPHDLYYFEEPTDMMAGEVKPPGCYLDAREILKRHFFAYCIDSWTSEDARQHAIPLFVRHLRLASTDLDDPQFFLNRLISFVKRRERELLERFRSVYAGQVDERVFHELEQSFLTGQFYHAPRRAFRNLQEEYNLIREKRRAINQYIKDKSLGEEDEERRELEKEKRNLWGALKTMEARQVLEHMTNVGLLPNYAFPETGVLLNARVVARGGVDSDGPPTSKDIELVRPARQAIKELAPDNHFYTQGYKLDITGLNVINWKEDAVDFRYCSNCDHLLEEARAEKTPCPKCGHASWGSEANKHRFLRLQAVKSFNEESRARIDDSSEERESELVLRTHHFRFNPQAAHGAYALRQIPFGIEFVREVDILEVNAGLVSDFVDRNRLATIKGTEVPLAGYITCRVCGRSSFYTHKKRDGGGHEAKGPRDFHYAYCRHREQAYEGKANDVFEELYLYREMKTEALKILLPVQEFESASTVSMFRAGMELGLKHYYQGNPQHIEFREYAEFNHQTLKMDQYLVLYDQIPGGTGYLERLFDPREFSDVLRRAYFAIRDCGCQTQGKDGCYRCIYSYSNQFDRTRLSRKRAEELFGRIFEALGDWEPVQHGLGNVTNTGQIEESELEERFPRALRMHMAQPAQKEAGCRLETVNQEGVICYRLRLVDQGNVLDYFIQPQYALGIGQGVQYATVPDFLIRCVGATLNGRQLSTDELSAFRSIAIYLDGYQYHASREHFRFPGDIRRRRSVSASPEYLTWTLTWSDIDHFEAEDSDLLGKGWLGNTKARDTLLRLPKYRTADKDFLQARNNFSRLLWILRRGLQSTIADLRTQFRFALACLQADFGGCFFSPSGIDAYLQTGQRPPAAAPGREGEEYFPLSVPLAGEVIDVRLLERLKDFDLKSRILIPEQSEGYPKEEWEQFWRIYNLLQVEEPNLRIVLGNEDLTSDEDGESASSGKGGALSEILPYYDGIYHPLVRELWKNNINFSAEGSFLLETEGIVVGEAVLGFPGARIVVGPLSEEDADGFRRHGYSIRALEEVDVAELIDSEAVEK